MIATLGFVARGVLARADAATAFFLGLSVYAGLRAYVEVDLYRPFEPLQTMFWVACAALPAYAAAFSRNPATVFPPPGVEPHRA